MTTVYLAGGMWQLDDEETHGWRRVAKHRLRGGVEYIDPAERDYRQEEMTRARAVHIVNEDLDAIDECDTMLAYCRAPSWGTAMEIAYARFCTNLTIIAVCDDDHLSPWLLGNTDRVFSSVEAAVDFINGSEAL